MEDLKKKGADMNDKEIVFSKSIKAGKRIYYLDVKKNRKDELGILGRDIDTLQSKLKEISSVIKDGSRVLTDAAKQLDASADNTLKAAQDISISVETASDSTIKQAEESQEVSKNMGYMGEILNNSIKEIKEIQALSTEMHMLGNKTADILKNLDESNQKSKETMDLYAPLANRIGMYSLKWELEDLSFKYLYPDEYREILEGLNEKREERLDFVDKIKKEILL